MASGWQNATTRAQSPCTGVKARHHKIFVQ